MTMTSGPEQRIERLDEHECWGRLLGSRVGRLAFEARGRIEIRPLNYVVRGRRLVFRAAHNADLLTQQRMPVSFEVDGWDTRAAWSVIAHGALRRNNDPAALALETDTGIDPWAPAEHLPRTALVEFVVVEVSGRQFPRRPAPDARWYW
jgi:uncharacterized protein